MHWYWIRAAVLVISCLLLHVSGTIEFDLTLHWTAWAVAGLVLLSGGWMAFDGGRALIVGDYVVPQTGPMAGDLGPWSDLVAGVGIDPRSTLMKSIFLVYGLAYVAAAAGLVLGKRSARRSVLFLALMGLWYVPFGMLLNVVVIVLLFLPPLRSVAR